MSNTAAQSSINQARSPPVRQSTTSSLTPPLICFTNCQICLHGELLPQDLYFSPETGLITPNYYYRTENVVRLDMGGRIISPGFLEVQSNGMGGIHFSTLGGNGDDDESNEGAVQRLARIARMEIEAGVTGFWATIPTVPRHRWKEILPVLAPRSFPENEGGVAGADLLGAHVEGPYLHPSKKGAHNESFFVTPDSPSDSGTPESVYGVENLTSMEAGGNGSIRLITLAPDVPGSETLITHLREQYPHITVSLGHSAATFEQGIHAVELGATMLTHTFNAMAPLHHRDPGLVGLMGDERVWYSVIPDGIHLHPSVLKIALRTNPGRCVLVTDSIELAGLDDGVHPGNNQIKGQQRKIGNKVVLEGTDTLVGSCIRLDECVRNMVKWTGCTLAEGVRCVTENVAGVMGLRNRGVLESGRRADFVVLDERGFVGETWIGGVKVWVRD